MLTTTVLTCCDSKRDATIKSQKSDVSLKVSLGDNIFAAKKVLEAEGFSIKYGPDFPTETKRYLMMIVDYGVRPNGVEIFKYTVGIEGSNKPITGVIKATPEGEITSIN
jgi:hypothetical protein